MMYYQHDSGAIEGSYVAGVKFCSEDEYNSSYVNPIPTDSSVVPKLSFLLSQLASSQRDYLQGNFTPFHTYTLPEISIRAYLDRIANYFRCSNECFVLALIYINRIGQLNKSTFNLSVYNIHRLLSTSVMIATKYTDDVYFSNGFYAQVSGLHIRELNSLEYLFLKLIDFSLFVSTPEYETFRSYIMNYAPYSIERKIDFKVSADDSNYYLGNSSRKQCFKSYNYLRGDYMNCDVNLFNHSLNYVPCDISTTSSVSYEPSDKSSTNSRVLSPDIAMKQIAQFDVQHFSPQFFNRQSYYFNKTTSDFWDNSDSQVIYSKGLYMQSRNFDYQEGRGDDSNHILTNFDAQKNGQNFARCDDQLMSTCTCKFRNCRSSNLMSSSNFSNCTDNSSINCDFRRVENLDGVGITNCVDNSNNFCNPQLYNYMDDTFKRDKPILGLNNNSSTVLQGPTPGQNSPFSNVVTSETVSYTMFHCSQFPIEQISHHISGF